MDKTRIPGKRPMRLDDLTRDDLCQVLNQYFRRDQLEIKYDDPVSEHIKKIHIGKGPGRLDSNHIINIKVGMHPLPFHVVIQEANKPEELLIHPPTYRHSFCSELIICFHTSIKENNMLWNSQYAPLINKLINCGVYVFIEDEHITEHIKCLYHED